MKTFKQLSEVIENAIRNSTKVKTITTRDNSWITTEIMNKMKQNRKAYQKHKQNINNQENKGESKRIKSELNILIKIRKK